MENRRLSQSERGGGTKKHRARSLVGLTLACYLVVGISSCSAPVESNEQTAAVEQKITGPDGHGVFAARGAVDFAYSIDIPEAGISIPVSCTGSMISPHVILTAARCFLPFSAAVPEGFEIKKVTINYYDPKFGRRKVHDGPAFWKSHPSFPSYSADPGILTNPEILKDWIFLNPGVSMDWILDQATGGKNGPKHGHRRGHPGPLRIPNPLIPDGAVDPFALDEGDTAKYDLAVIIVEEELGSLSDWGPTDYHDYLRVFSEPAHLHLNATLNAFGAGLYDYGAGYSDDQLRYANFDTSVENNGSAGPDYLKLEGRQGGDRVNMCRGDSGGTVEYSVTVEGQPVPTVAAVWSNFNMGIGEVELDPPYIEIENPYCANNNHSHDDSYACIIHDEHVQWLESATGLSCVDQTGGNLGYKRCFEIPMIEDAPGEGLYEPNVATAIAMTAL